jgi:hypothetical protein
MIVCIIVNELLKKVLFTSTVDLNLRKKVLKCYN